MLKCEICGKSFKVLNNFHLRTHGITWLEYKLKYPNAKVMSNEVLMKQSMRMKGNTYQKGVPRTEETKRKMSLAHIGKPSTMLGKRHSIEAKHKMSLAMIGNNYALGNKHTIETKCKISLGCLGNKSNTGRCLTDTHKQNIKLSLNKPEIKSKQIAGRHRWLESNGGHLPESHKNHLALATKRAMGTDVYWENYRKGRCLKPNKLESLMQQILDSNFGSGTWEYVGDFKFYIENTEKTKRRCPDFRHSKFKKLIEVYNEFDKMRNYGSIENYKNVSDKFYKSCGYDVIYFSQEQINNKKPEVINDVRTLTPVDV